jgi:hypothetical protein
MAQPRIKAKRRKKQKRNRSSHLQRMKTGIRAKIHPLHILYLLMLTNIRYRLDRSRTLQMCSAMRNNEPFYPLSEPSN